ncbi:MAG: D-alanyl-D-alanine carboxypeptidase, partial [Ramlibacter sp.]|nr:D-alanyl-D-alanine carboxypeptidase [Ramlibacter sp.]
MAPRTRNLRLAALLAALIAAGAVPLWYQHQSRPASSPRATAQTAPGAPAASGADGQVAAAAADAEVVPPEESETDRGPNAASPGGPVLSFGRAAGLHLAPDPLRLSASAALVVDQDSGQPLLQKNADAILPMASLTKLMTTLLVTEAKQPMDEVLTITDEDVDTVRHSRSRLRVGTRLTREEALHLALMSSENRAANALGRNYPGGLPKLVEAMNARAKALGMKNTTYVDPTGLSNQNRSTARDLALLVAAASKNPVLREFSTDPQHVASLGGRPLQYTNSNRLVRNSRSGWDIELQKTGYIVEAGRCLTMLAKVAGHNLVMVMLDADSNGTRMADAEKMRRWVVAQNGWRDNPAVAKAQAAPVQKVVAVKRKASAGKKEKVTLARKDTGRRTVTAARKGEGKKAVASSSKEGR